MEPANSLSTPYTNPPPPTLPLRLSNRRANLEGRLHDEGGLEEDCMRGSKGMGLRRVEGIMEAGGGQASARAEEGVRRGTQVGEDDSRRAVR